MARGFERSLISRVKDAAGAHPDADLADARRFIALFSSRSRWGKGTEIQLERGVDGSVCVRVDGAVIASIASGAVGWALVDTYLGEHGHATGAARDQIVRCVRAALGNAEPAV